MAIDELLLAETREALVRRHAVPHRVVVHVDVLEALLAHAARNQLLSLFDRLHQLTWRHAKLLGAKARRRLRLRSSHGWCEEDGEQARVDRLLHRSILSNKEPNRVRVAFLVTTSAGTTFSPCH